MTSEVSGHIYTPGFSRLATRWAEGQWEAWIQLGGGKSRHQLDLGSATKGPLHLVLAEVRKSLVHWGHPNEPIFVDGEPFKTGNTAETYKNKMFVELNGTRVENGMSHPAEEPLAQAFVMLDDAETEIQQWVLYGCKAWPSVAADLLQLIGRRPEPIRSFNALLLLCSQSVSIEVRDSAITTIENWNVAELVPLLDERRETAGYLREQIMRMKADIHDAKT